MSILTRALRLLETYSLEQPELGITELSRVLGLPKSTVHRIVAELQAAGYLRQSSRTGKYRLSPRLWELGSVAVASLELREAARPYLETLSLGTRETINLVVLDEADALYVDEIQGRQPVRAHSYVGTRAPAHCVATGKAILAWTVGALDRREELGLVRFTPHTIVDRVELERELKVVREQGYAVNREEWRADICAVAAPVRDHTNRVVAALGVSGPAHRLSRERLRELGLVASDTAGRLSRELGYRP